MTKLQFSYIVATFEKLMSHEVIIDYSSHKIGGPIFQDLILPDNFLYCTFDI